MPPSSRGRSSLLLAALLPAVLAFGSTFPACAAGARLDPPVKEKRTPTRFYYGVSLCSNGGCHGFDKPRIEPDDPPLCRCTEATIWQKDDKHKEAYNVLLQPRAREMGRLLKVDVTKPEGGCLACHGVVIADDKLKEKRSFKIEDGVSCVVCHGAYADWVDEHDARVPLRRDKWRALSRQYKDEEWGMTDLWDPVKRTQLCTSCHVGSTAGDKNDRKFITHAMYAAGHPPLPGIELGTFSAEMPRHWQYIREKPDPIQKLLKFSPEEARFEQTKLVLVSSVAAFRASLDLLASQADECARAEDAENRALDLAQFDCYACHHELRSPSWRQTRGYVGRPGRLTMRPWPTALVRVGLHDLGREETELDTRLRKLADAFTDYPLGDPRKIAAEARDLAKWAESLTATLAGRTWDARGARRLLETLATFREKDYPDYDAARQLVWAYLVVYSEMKDREYAAVPDAAKPLHELLDVRLPSRRAQQILDDLPIRLRKMTDYDPAQFKREFGKMSQELLKE